ncbi:hypothetical protein [Proteiniclasticum sp.]|uniref:hypothetical protein n=1 Tax=Proteiniclasticum sp. TaxID=2053595 RepID=UPI0028A01106|nr:hypothetical protein [Proteiniclasticum sp.]
MKNFFSALFLSFFVFVLSLIVFGEYGAILFAFIALAGLISLLLSQDARIEEMEKILGLREEKEKQGIPASTGIEDETEDHKNE